MEPHHPHVERRGVEWYVVTLLAADGYTHLHPARVELTLPMLPLFLDGRETLRHASALAQLRVGLICTYCAAHTEAGYEASVVVVDRPQDGTVFVACPHRPTGGIVQTRATLHLQSLLHALGWNLACTECRHVLQGDNDPASLSFTVRCPCTTREYRYKMA